MKKEFNFLDTSKTPAGLARTHRIIRTQKDKEVQFLKLCSAIKLEDFKNLRSENQRNARRIKRLE